MRIGERYCKAVVLFLGAALAGCSQGSEPAGRFISEDEVAKRLGAAAPHLPRPGEYESHVRIDGENVAAGEGGTTRACLTKEQLADPVAALITGGRADCAYRQFDFRGPDLSADMRCIADGVAQELQLTASYRADGFVIAMRAANGDGSHRTIDMTAQRLGDCG
ncbi:DUF3617 domain-containing protein [Sphingomicrobium lutaoense]|uniref:DUF3617 domain-containing protein n=1 Tax=Sphingomicrobium lutaoense TaxID=515949 RepID=A0A839Z3W7_9SPHN|nr:DUF3617 family protein [Sphingomicrobium lutaoense]MBB3764513.1 hypothetical protein [Sphingomicrobium lutaoense]